MMENIYLEVTVCTVDPEWIQIYNQKIKKNKKRREIREEWHLK
jgi:hypothetical protein